jgi:hypothetical protein
MARRAMATSALALLIALFIGSGSPSAHPPAPAGFYGVSGWNTEEADFERMADADVGVYRASFPIGLVRPVPDEPFVWTYFDRLVYNTASNGIDLLPMIYGVPLWHSEERSATPVHDPVARHQWHEALVAFVERYGPGGVYWAEHPELEARPIHIWQIWNEPNSKTWWGPRPNPREYGTLLRRSERTIHSVDPTAQLMTAGIVARPTNPDAIRGPAFLRGLFARAAVRSATDLVAYHPYAPTVHAVRIQLQKMRGVLTHLGVTAPAWVTEVGWGSDGPREHPLIKSRPGQRLALAGTFEMIRKRRRSLGIDRVLWYLWQDRTDTLCLWCESSGLVDVDGKPKRLLETFRGLATR